MTHAQVRQAMEDKGINPHDVIWQHVKHTYNPVSELVWRWIIIIVGIYGIYLMLNHIFGV